VGVAVAVGVGVGVGVALGSGWPRDSEAELQPPRATKQVQAATRIRERLGTLWPSPPVAVRSLFRREVHRT
jgi:hypothetical protein